MRAIRLEPIPPVYYREPLGLPLRWQDEQSGLPAIVRAFWWGEPLDIAQLLALRAYLCYYIDAPCWHRSAHDSPDVLTELAELRQGARHLQQREDIDAWLERCLEMGIDPL